MTENAQTGGESYLQRADLIPDSRLRDGEPDAFRHQPIAARVAELAAYGEPPLNVALFGPWGSGKSSIFELLRTELRRVDPKIEPVRYDAWKFGGAELKRNFISSAATELGLPDGDDKNRKYHGGLYESSRTARFDPAELFKNGRWRSLLLIPAIGCGLAAIVVLALALVSSAFGNVGFSHELGRFAPSVGASISGVLVTVGAALRILDGAKVETERVVPSADEQFTKVFENLVEDAKQHLKKSRLVFFIDELDRCSKEDVVSTLTSLRTFLDQESCVFVVAADREVLEEALSQVEQATPVREDEPYYSSASAFLDKIFQHQFSLPPLRGLRLTGFARERVADRGGLWADLRTDGTLDAVLYTLIPSHVRSPRRVKVLLNNFATNARVTEARGIAWRPRATEIAKLTVLQTEFPRLAADLHLEPNLPALLLAPPPSPTRRQKALLERHQLGSDDAVEGPETDDDTDVQPPQPAPYEPPDRLLAGGKNEVLVRQQREDLLRYLQSRQSGAKDPGRDLLFLEAAGDWVGLADAELNQIIEDEASARPGRVLDALAGRSASERYAAARLIGHLSEREFGTERSNMMTAFAGALDGLTPEEITEPDQLLANVRSYQAEQPLTTDQLTGMFVLATAAGPAGKDLATVVLRESSLLATASRVARLAQLLPSVDDETAAPIEAAVVGGYMNDPATLLGLVETQPAESVARLLRSTSKPLVTALVAASPPAPAPTPAAAVTGAAKAAPEPVEPEPSGSDAEVVAERAEVLLAALDERGEELRAAKAELMVALLDNQEPATYRACQRRALPLAKATPEPEHRNRLALSGVAAAPPQDWADWADLIVDFAEEREDWLVEDALARVTTDVASHSPEILSTLPRVVQRILAAGDVRADQENHPVTVASDLVNQLAMQDWWTGDAELATQIRMHEVAIVLAAKDVWATPISDGLVADVVRAAPETVAWDDDIARRFAALAVTSTTPALQAADEALSVHDEPWVLVWITIAVELRTRGADPASIPTTDVVAATNAGSGSADEILTGWLTLSPSTEDLTAVIAGQDKYRPSAEPALREVCTRLDGPDSLGLLLALLDSECDPKWFAPAGVSVEPDQAIAQLTERMASAAGPNRDRVYQAVAAVPLTSPAARRGVGLIAIELLTDSPNHAKSEIAARLAELLHGSNYQVKGQLKETIAIVDGAGQLGDKARKKFEHLGLINKKKHKFLGITLP